MFSSRPRPPSRTADAPLCYEATQTASTAAPAAAAAAAAAVIASSSDSGDDVGLVVGAFSFIYRRPRNGPSPHFQQDRARSREIAKGSVLPVLVHRQRRRLPELGRRRRRRHLLLPRRRRHRKVRQDKFEVRPRRRLAVIIRPKLFPPSRSIVSPDRFVPGVTTALPETAAESAEVRSGTEFAPGRSFAKQGAGLRALGNRRLSVGKSQRSWPKTKRRGISSRHSR